MDKSIYCFYLTISSFLGFGYMANGVVYPPLEVRLVHFEPLAGFRNWRGKRSGILGRKIRTEFGAWEYNGMANFRVFWPCFQGIGRGSSTKKKCVSVPVFYFATTILTSTYDTGMKILSLDSQINCLTQTANLRFLLFFVVLQLSAAQSGFFPYVWGACKHAL